MDRLKERNLEAFAYADDLAIIGICKVRLIEALNVVEEWAEENNLNINKNKSGILIHGERGRARKEDEGYLRDYPYKKSYKYLGI